MTALFTADSLRFLDELKHNNNREWWNANKDRYEDKVRGPALEVVRRLQGPLAKISAHFPAVAKKTGGAMMRPFRDTRFSKDKTPYKTNVGLHFRHDVGKDVHAPGFYLHVNPEEAFLGAGMWKPDNPTLAKVRAAIDADHDRWRKLTTGKPFHPLWKLGDGDKLKRPPKGYAKDHPLIEDIKRRSFTAAVTLDPKQLLGDELIALATRYFTAVAPFVKFQCEALDLEF